MLKVQARVPRARAGRHQARRISRADIFALGIVLYGSTTLRRARSAPSRICWPSTRITTAHDHPAVADRADVSDRARDHRDVARSRSIPTSATSRAGEMGVPSSRRTQAGACGRRRSATCAIAEPMTQLFVGAPPPGSRARARTSRSAGHALSASPRHSRRLPRWMTCARRRLPSGGARTRRPRRQEDDRRRPSRRTLAAAADRRRRRSPSGRRRQHAVARLQPHPPCARPPPASTCRAAADAARRLQISRRACRRASSSDPPLVGAGRLRGRSGPSSCASARLVDLSAPVTIVAPSRT